LFRVFLETRNGFFLYANMTQKATLFWMLRAGKYLLLEMSGFMNMFSQTLKIMILI